jgi:hypothetical protein
VEDRLADTWIHSKCKLFVRYFFCAILLDLPFFVYSGDSSAGTEIWFLNHSMEHFKAVCYQEAKGGNGRKRFRVAHESEPGWIDMLNFHETDVVTNRWIKAYLRTRLGTLDCLWCMK